MKILHIPQKNFAIKNGINGIKSVLLNEIEWENRVENLESKILILGKIEEKNIFYINKKSIKKDISEYAPDIVIFDGFWEISHYFIAKFLKKKQIKYFIKPHGGFSKIAERENKVKFIKKLIAKKIIFDNYVKNSSGILFLSHFERKNSIYKNEYEFILPNGIEKRKINCFDIENKCLNKKINFIYLGRIDIKTKGLDILLKVLIKNKAFFINNHIKFNFYGSGHKSEMKIFYKYLKECSEYVEYYGSVHGKDKYEILQKNDIFILTSRHEGMPMGVLEALSVGVPCFVSRATGMEDLISKYNAGWINIYSENLFLDLKKCIFEYRKNKINYQRKALECKEKFLWENIIFEYRKIYLNIIK